MISGPLMTSCLSAPSDPTSDGRVSQSPALPHISPESVASAQERYVIAARAPIASMLPNFAVGAAVRASADDSRTIRPTQLRAGPDAALVPVRQKRGS